MFTGFYKRSREERIEMLFNAGKISSSEREELLKNETLNVDIAGKMTENHIGSFSLPFSIVPNILVDNVEYSVPLVTEEPSVVAACSNASKIIAKSGGFKTIVHNREMIGHVALYDVPNITEAKEIVLDNEKLLINIANDAHPSIVTRGGGARSIAVEIKQEENTTFLIVYLSVDTKEAMGANMLNTMLEALKPSLENLTGGIALMGILSNFATNSLVTATCSININTLNSNPKKAYNIAKKIDLASKFAKADPYRAATHNKGIFNGIDGILIATGNDWRAIEAACHTYASRNGRYEGLSTWTFDEDNLLLNGQLTLPMPVATVGGSIGLNNSVKIAHSILGNVEAKKLASIIVASGLAQNFAAVRALVTVGIQQGHMKLHAKSLALLAGANADEVELVASQLSSAKHINLATASEILTTLRTKTN